MATKIITMDKVVVAFLIITIAISVVSLFYVSGLSAELQAIKGTLDKLVPSKVVKDELKFGLPIAGTSLGDGRRTSSNVEQIVCSLSEETLVTQDWSGAAMQLKPCLAESWSQYNSTFYEFKLRRGVKFHCGREMTAYDVEYSLKSHYDPDFPAVNSWAIAPFKYFEAVDNYTIHIGADSVYGPGAASRASLSWWKVLCSYHAELWGAQFGSPGTPVNHCATGPYRLVDWISGEKTVLKRFEDYWGVKPQIETITFIPIPDATTRIIALETGSIDATIDLGLAELLRLRGLGYNVQTAASTRPHWIGFNCMKPPFNDTRVRQAMNYAIDKDAIVKSVFNNGAIKGHFIPSNIFGYIDVPVYDYNVTKAKQLLVEAGYPDGFSCELWAFKGRLINFEQEVEAVAGYLSKVGINAQIRYYEYGAFVSAMAQAVKILPPDAPNYDLFSITFNNMQGDADYNLPIFGIAIPGMPLGTSWYNDPFRYADMDVNGWLVQARSTTDVDLRLELYRKAITKMVDDAPVIFLVFQPEVLVTNPKLKGILQLPIDIYNLQTAYWEE